MKNIYFLQVMCYLDEEKHYENVYSTKERAIKEGITWLEKLLTQQYENWFEETKDLEMPKLTHDQLFQLKAIYNFSITEYDPEYMDSLDDIENLPKIKELDIHDTFVSDLSISKIKHTYDHNGKEIYISAIYLFEYKGKTKEYEITMDYEDYLDKNSGTKFQKGDIVKIKNHSDYKFCDQLHVITNIPYKKENQRFFKNNYDVIVNHNCYDEGCHVDTFYEKDLELYTGKLPKDSPLIFLSKYFKGEIKLKNIKWIDIECGKITLNENKSFRDIPEIMEQIL